MPSPELSQQLPCIRGVKIAGSSSHWDINLDYQDSHGTISSITPHGSSREESQFPLVLPALTHPHIHLDKAFVHSACEYAHLLPSNGSFQEALYFTTKAKEQFTYPGLLQRGEWLLAESVASGVTAMRAFVEVDHTVQFKCLDAAVTLKEQWRDSCHVQIVCFAQDPIFSGEHGEENKTIIEDALERYSQIDVIGTTPYVETSPDASKKNIDWAIHQALKLHKHLDFHLDYNLDTTKEPLVWYILTALQQQNWNTRSTNQLVMLGHCTRLTLFSEEDWIQISRIIHDNELPVSFVGLPTSDIYMAAPPGQEKSQNPPRGTLQVPKLIRNHGLDVVIGVNNVGNAFTPWGSADPLFLACLGVGIYQAGTQADADLLYECVSTRARASIGLSPPQNLAFASGGCTDFVIFRDRDETGCGVSRQRDSVRAVVWDPPARFSRDVIINGRLKGPVKEGVISDSGLIFLGQK
ncbi:hypothetical protein N7495_002701 [Penicillium taxi]|uniref:uncharacterized protein n=1 Tax=Penicillium taxi TaxID=168475 RepID=UPI00254512DE|nr:uncharacterized protein N7495_002701 [Penicillium taxi]KAJ5902173.1 hypothetical protein N7495_002701 [Penicillium taxi]